MKRESTIGQDVAGVAIGAVLSALLFANGSVVGEALPPWSSLNIPADNLIYGSLGIAALLGMTLPAHGIRLRSLVGGALLVGIGAANLILPGVGTLPAYGPQWGQSLWLEPGELGTRGGEFFIPASVMFVGLTIHAAAVLAASFGFGLVIAWAGRGLLGLVKRRSPRQGHQEQQAASREQEASAPAHRASTLSAAKEGVMPAAEEVAITRH